MKKRFRWFRDKIKLRFLRNRYDEITLILSLFSLDNKCLTFIHLFDYDDGSSSFKISIPFLFSFSLYFEYNYTYINKHEKIRKKFKDCINGGTGIDLNPVLCTVMFLYRKEDLSRFISGYSRYFTFNELLKGPVKNVERHETNIIELKRLIHASNGQEEMVTFKFTEFENVIHYKRWFSKCYYTVFVDCDHRLYFRGKRENPWDMDDSSIGGGDRLDTRIKEFSYKSIDDWLDDYLKNIKGGSFTKIEKLPVLN